MKKKKKKKMLSGELYDAAHDEQLKRERKAAQNLCFEYNRLSPADENCESDNPNAFI